VKGIPEWVRDHPGAFWEGVAYRAPLLLSLFAVPAAILWPEVRRSLRRWRDEHTSGLWLSMGLLYVLGLFFAAAYYSLMPSEYDQRRLDSLRYVTVGIVPLLWAAVRKMDFGSREARKRLATLAVVSLAMGAAVLMFPAQQLANQAGRSMDPYLEEGDLVEIHGTGKYALYATLSRPQDITVYAAGHGDPAGPPEWVLSSWPHETMPGYTLAREKRVDHPTWPVAQDDVFQVWVRDDVLAARNVTLEPWRPGW
jgi:uncharacterized membrane protein YhaH (DUF805 family)